MTSSLSRTAAPPPSSPAQVVGIDRHSRVVLMDGPQDGGQAVGYDLLVLTPGLQVRRGGGVNEGRQG